jgi:hypothetical protein
LDVLADHRLPVLSEFIEANQRGERPEKVGVASKAQIR